MTAATSGPPSHQPFAFYDPESSSVRTSQATLLSDSTPCSVTLPKWGWLHGGALYELPTPALLTSGHDYSGLLPTPAVTDMGARKTPEQWDEWTDDMRARHGNGNGHGRSLAIETQRLLPTPIASDSHGGEGATREQRQKDKATGGPSLRDVGHLLPAPRAARDASTTETTRLLPTPTAGDGKAARNETAGRLNPDSKHHAGTTLTDLAFSGDLTSQPSEGGSSSTEPRHPGQLTIGDA
jgi:hypothetical protein